MQRFREDFRIWIVHPLNCLRMNIYFCTSYFFQGFVGLLSLVYALMCQPNKPVIAPAKKEKVVAAAPEKPVVAEEHHHHHHADK